MCGKALESAPTTTTIQLRLSQNLELCAVTPATCVTPAPTETEEEGVTERTRTPSVSPAHPYLWGRGGRDGRLPGHEAGRDALHDPGEARRAMVLPSRPGVGGEPQDLGRTRAVHHVHHRYTTEGVLPIVAGCCHTRDLALISRFCNLQPHMATYVGGLWLKRRSRVRAPSVTPRSQVKTRGSDFRRDLVYCNPLRR